MTEDHQDSCVLAQSELSGEILNKRDESLGQGRNEECEKVDGEDSEVLD